MKVSLPLLLVLFIIGCGQKPQESLLDLNTVLGGQVAQEFERAIQPRVFHFPEDHAAHPGFRNEWWYITGNLIDEAGKRYGYQVTLFRIALSPRSQVSASNWATNQVWMAHVALTDVSNGQHWHEQRLARGAAGLAGQRSQPFIIWLEDWQITGSERGMFPWNIKLQTEKFTLDLELTSRKAVVLQGDKGLSQKSAMSGNASYYYSFTRLQTEGEISIDEYHTRVNGWSWLDREWSTSALASDQAGWDWFSLQLDDGHDLMFYRLRKKNGTTDPYSAGNWILPDGSLQALSAQDAELKPVQYWRSPSGRTYPVKWEMLLPAAQKRFRVEALIENQEMATGIYYWEGAVKVLDVVSDEVAGYGYLEMTGY